MEFSESFTRHHLLTSTYAVAAGGANSEGILSSTLVSSLALSDPFAHLATTTTWLAPAFYVMAVLTYANRSAKAFLHVLGTCDRSNVLPEGTLVTLTYMTKL
jgi:hypothetical protein